MYLFTITLAGHGKTAEEAWEDAAGNYLEELMKNGAGDAPEMFIEEADPDNDEFKCALCGRIGDVEDSLEDLESKTLLCDACYNHLPEHCVCDNTHKQNKTVCAFCYIRTNKKET